MLRLVYLLLYVSSAILVPGMVWASQVQAKQNPNILLLLADDMGYNDSAIYQDIYHQQPVASMPALEGLAKQGVRFTRFYTESTCSTSRVALLTGQYPARQGFAPVARGISPDVITLPEFLKGQGYTTYHVGKWHMGEINKEAFPLNQGFDSSFGFLNQWMLKGPDANGRTQLKSPTYINPWLLDEETKLHLSSYKQYSGHLEDILTERTVKLIRNNVGANRKPWFIYHAFFAPHTPEEAAQRFAKQFPDTEEGKYKAQLAQLDDSVSQIMAALKETQQWDNTIIIFASDNGAPEKHSHSNAPFSGGKAAYDEGGVRTPLLIKWHKPYDQQGTRNDTVSIMDIYPSLVATLTSAGPDVSSSSYDGVPDLLNTWSPRKRASSLFFLTFDELSVLDKNGKQRLIKHWDNGKFTHSKQLNYYEGLANVIEPGFLDKFTTFFLQENTDLFERFLQWRNSIRSVPATFTLLSDRGAGKLTGRDFLRTPMNPAYALAFSFTADTVDKKQTLLYQKDVAELTLNKGVLVANINGLVVHAQNIQPNQCYSVVLSGEFYDRYSSVQGDIRESHLHLIIDGKEVETAHGKIDSFEKIKISEPTFVGLRDEKNKELFMGEITQPKIFTTQLLPDDKPVSSDIEDILKNMCSHNNK